MAFNLMSFGGASTDQKAQLAALHRSMAVIEFSTDGTILDANPNFLGAMGYTIEQIRGQHHRIFVTPEEAASAAYRQFWEKLARGEFVADQFLRVAAGGREVWIEASYNPLLNGSGKPYKIVKFATVITNLKERQAETEGQIAAINKAMAVIEFSLDGYIQRANDAFLAVSGYTLDEIVGKHHGMFCEADYRNSESYRQFWMKLARGEYDSGQYQRVAKGGREFWVEASYNPIMDAQGRPSKVVKYAADITQQKLQADSLKTGVDDVRHVVEAAKNKDLTKRVTLQGKTGDVASLCESVNGLLDNVTDVIGTVGVIAREIGTASAKFSNESANLAERTESQASSLQETAATTEELAASIKQSAGHSRQAAALGEEAKVVASRGGEIVSEAVVAMERIETASTSISDIISMIDEISFQTNLLALNAAVEAARAGDAGRGFAVVASEVRALAKRSSESANGIKELIGNSSEQVRSGVSLVKQAGKTLQEIVSAATRVAGTISEISSASIEQSSGVEEMAKTVAHMDEMTQQNSLLADNSSKLARDLVSDAERLNQLVDAFVVGQGRRDFTAQISEQLKTRAPHMSAPRTPAPVARAAPKLRAAGGGQSGGWEEF